VTHRISFNIILDLCQLLSGKAVPSGDGDDDESEYSSKEQPEKGKGKKPVKDKKKPKVKKSVLEIDDSTGEDGQFRDLINS
jgi:hypothetical protein